jgi:hypothetical protein
MAKATKKKGAPPIRRRIDPTITGVGNLREVIRLTKAARRSAVEAHDFAARSMSQERSRDKRAAVANLAYAVDVLGRAIEFFEKPI